MDDPDWQKTSLDQTKDETSTPKKRKSTHEHVGKGSKKKPKKTHTSTDDSSIKDDPDDFTYPCEKCNDTFDNQEELQKHRRHCSKVPKKYMCPKCPKGFHQKSLKDQHYRHRHTKLPPLYVCHICNRIYEFDKTLKRHNKKFHDPKAKKFVCEICGKEFRSNWEFKQHRNGMHLNIKDYQCGRCKEASFTTSGRLNQHLQSCGQEKNFVCEECDEKFLTQGNLNTHIEDHHDKKERICPVRSCAKIFTSTGGYYNHCRKAHGLGLKGGMSVKEYIRRQKEESEKGDDNHQ